MRAYHTRTRYRCIIDDGNETPCRYIAAIARLFQIKVVLVGDGDYALSCDAASHARSARVADTDENPRLPRSNVLREKPPRMWSPRALHSKSPRAANEITPVFTAGTSVLWRLFGR